MKTLQAISLSLLSLILIAFACSYTSPPSSRSASEWTLVVENQNWTNASVHVFCDGARTEAFSTIQTYQERQTQVQAVPCQEAVLIIDLLANGGTYVVPPFRPNPDDCFKLVIKNALSLSDVNVCRRV